MLSVHSSHMKDRNEHLFLVRVWREPPGDWRGFVEHVTSQHRVYFTNVTQVADALLLRLANHDHKDTDRSDPP